MITKRPKTPTATRISTPRIRILCWMAVVAMAALGQGCNEGAGYVGQMLQPPADKVVLFEIQGPDGPEFTDMLATQLTRMGKVVVRGSQFGDPTDMMTAAKVTRDNHARAFVMGRLTASEIVDLSKYTVSGTFTLHEVEAGDQIGGIVNVSHSEDFDELLGIGKLLSVIDYRQFEQEKLKEAKVKAVQCRRHLAEYIGTELCCKGLGGMTPTHHKMATHKTH